MGSNLSPVVADTVINTLLKSTILKLNFQIPYLVQYVDDNLYIFLEDHIDETCDIFNEYDTRTQFTI